jgi:hypothetical protein
MSAPRKYPRGKDGTAAATDSSKLALQPKSEIYIYIVLFCNKRGSNSKLLFQNVKKLLFQHANQYLTKKHVSDVIHTKAICLGC